MKNSDFKSAVVPSLLFLVSIGVAAYFVHVSTTRVFTHLEGVLLQVFALVVGLTSSFIFGRQAADDRARELIKPHARSAIRRLRFLSAGLGRVAQAIRDCESPENYRETLAILRAIVVEQLAAADDALEEWEDIVPEDVRALRERLLAGGGRRANND